MYPRGEFRSPSPDIAAQKESKSQSPVDIVLEHTRSERPKLQEFLGKHPLYTQREIQHDETRVRRAKEDFKRKDSHLPKDQQKRNEERKKLSDALESTVVNLGELSDWFGENSSVIQTTEYVDIVQHIDGILEIKIEIPNSNGQTRIERIALAVDASTSNDEDIIKKKIITNGRIMTSSPKNSEPAVKYFESSDGTAGPIQDIIPVVIGLEKESTESLVGLYANILKARQSKIPGEARQLKDKAQIHPAQRLFIRQIKTQLISYHRILKTSRDPQKNTLMKKLETLFNLFDEIEREKEKQGIKLDSMINDGVYNQITTTCNTLTLDQLSLPRN